MIIAMFRNGMLFSLKIGFFCLCDSLFIFFNTPDKLFHIFVAVAERPQHMLMRVAVGIHGEDIDSAIDVSSVVRSLYPQDLPLMNDPVVTTSKLKLMAYVLIS